MSKNRDTQTVIVPIRKEKGQENCSSDQMRSKKLVDLEILVGDTIKKEKCLRLQRE